MKSKRLMLSLCLLGLSSSSASAHQPPSNQPPGASPRLPATTDPPTNQPLSNQPPGASPRLPAAGAGGLAASASKPAVVRTLDEIRAELEKKKAESQANVGGMDSGMAGGMPFGGEGGGMPGAGMDGGMGMSGGMGMEGGMGMGMPQPSEKQLVGMLIHQLRSRLESKDQQREKVEKQLRAALEQYFLLDMEERVREFDKVKARVVAMEAKLQRRLESEADIIDLQIKQMVHKADGLDFTIPSNTGYGMGMGGMGMGAMGGMEMGGMGGGMMGMESGAGMGAGMMAMEGMPPDLSQPGYDILFGLTRLQRVDSPELDSDDPLNGYADTKDTALTSDSNDNQSQKLKTLLLALHQFHTRFKHFPKCATQIRLGQPPHSWRVAILPLVGEGELYKQYQFDQPWDSAQNRRVAEQMPAIFQSTPDQKDKTSFMMLEGAGTIGSTRVPTRIAEITDGTSNTIALIHSDQEVPWTKPEDAPYSASGKLPTLNRSRLVGLADGTVQTLADISADAFRALITRSGGEVLNIEQIFRQ
ncbi:MAG: DUF1559 domain-containing protein [Pirellulaceae bacterium]|nr:DUF1559 domain-containing protein [Pirellulaceae bacterium]